MGPPGVQQGRDGDSRRARPRSAARCRTGRGLRHRRRPRSRSPRAARRTPRRPPQPGPSHGSDRHSWRSRRGTYPGGPTPTRPVYCDPTDPPLSPSRRTAMPATRVMPTEESAELVRLVRDFATRELLPRSAAAEADEHVPARRLPDARRAGGAGPAVPRGVRRRRPALRGVPPGAGGDRRGLGERRGGRLGARAVLLRPRHPRAPRSRSSSGSPTCSAATCSAPTACPRRTPAPTRPRCGPRPRRDGDHYVLNGAARPGPRTAATPTSTR